jgi:hypothetical protein
VYCATKTGFSTLGSSSKEVVDSLTSIQGRVTKLFYQNSWKTEKNYPGIGNVLPNKRWCTPQQEMVYSPTRDGVLPNKRWCTPQQEVVYSPTKNSVLSDKS